MPKRARSSRSFLQTRIERTSITATTAFINIPHLKQWPPDTAYRAIVGLHRVLRKRLAAQIGQGLDILSALTGAIVVVPDGANLYLHRHLSSLGAGWCKMGIPVRVGVAHGEIEVLSDVDGWMNVIGDGVNVAARLASRRDRPGCVLHRSYLDSIKGVVDNGSFLKGSRSVSLSGKAHDQQKMRGLWIAPEVFETVRHLDEVLLPKYPARPPVNSVALGYDLPQFSGGDRSELSKRFRSVVDVFNTIRSEGQLGPSSSLHFSPGGDGGVIVLQAEKRSGYQLAERLAKLLQIESAGRDDRIHVRTRIGVHYGPVYLYTNAVGVLRPIGHVCFVADAIASDQTSVGSSSRSVVFSEAFLDIVTDGSREYFVREFEELPALSGGPAKNIKRFVRREIAAKPEDALYKRLVQRRGSWEPEPNQ
jgi:hypothetical protein